MASRHACWDRRASRAATILALAWVGPIGLPAALADEPAMQYPLGVAATEEGMVYVADLHLPGIWKIAEGKAEIYFQASKRFRTPLNRVRCVAIDSKGRLLAGDSATREIYRFGKDAKPEPLTHGMIGTPVVIAVDSKGTIFASDLETQRIWSFPPDGLKPGQEPTEVAVIAGVRGLAFDNQGRLLAVTTRADPVRRIDNEGNVEVLVEGRPFDFPHQIAVDKNGTMYISDNYAKAIWKVPQGGGETQPLVEGKPLDKPVGLTGLGKDLLVADPHARKLFRVTTEGKISPLLKEFP